MNTATAIAPDIMLDAALLARIREIADRRGESPGQLVRAALDHLEATERARHDADEAFYQEALEAEREYERTGLHITLDELFAWFDRLDTEPDAPLPPCHR